MISIGNRRECFFDSFLINEAETTAEKRLNKSQRCNVLLELNKPWEGKYNTFFCPIYAEGKPPRTKGVNRRSIFAICAKYTDFCEKQMAKHLS